jgi:hypothetical protein
MSDERDDDESVRFLLSGGRLSGAERERILARTLRASAAGAPGPGPAARGRRWLALAAAALVPAAAAALFLLVPRAGRDAGEGAGARAKGPAAGAMLQARCPERAPGRCRPGDRLVFEIDGAPQGGLLAAYAEGPAGERVWYFPASDGHLAAVPAAAGHAVVGEAARLGGEHAPGRYTVHLYLLDHPADRAALLEGRAQPSATAAIPLDVAP